ncbi:hypothetical protein [Nocardiopsis lucentensis]|uniref:hypothetical protein n=1 Tax=Nocardiopsis lucentensis TaxID=53441 RepID=UPI0004755B30|nr:hypothetical protein [Nocardiopsis lucentensis]
MFTQPGDAPGIEPDSSEGIRRMLTEIILDASTNAPRSRQRRIGPSEVGDPCPRRLAYKLMDWPAANDGGDPWPSIVGTATHDWLANALERHNRQTGTKRFLVEERVHVDDSSVSGYRLSGSCDAYDTATHTVIDHKVVGDSVMRKYKTEGVREQYRIQANLYGLGWENAGYTPQTVALAFYPRGGMLGGLWVWTDVYDRTVALDALKRLGTIRDALIALDPEARPQMWEHLPAQPSSACRFCPFWKPGSADLAVGCPGDLTTHQATTAA